MKNLLVVIALTAFFSCNSGSEKMEKTDSMNRIEDHPLTDTAVGPNPDGYAPPNTDMDTSKYRKDSINARDTADATKQ